MVRGLGRCTRKAQVGGALGQDYPNSPNLVRRLSYANSVQAKLLDHVAIDTRRYSQRYSGANIGELVRMLHHISAPFIQERAPAGLNDYCGSDFLDHRRPRDFIAG